MKNMLNSNELQHSLKKLRDILDRLHDLATEDGYTRIPTYVEQPCKSSDIIKQVASTRERLEACEVTITEENLRALDVKVETLVKNVDNWDYKNSTQVRHALNDIRAQFSGILPSINEDKSSSTDDSLGGITPR